MRAILSGQLVPPSVSEAAAIKITVRFSQQQGAQSFASSAGEDSREHRPADNRAQDQIAAAIPEESKRNPVDKVAEPRNQVSDGL